MQQLTGLVVAAEVGFLVPSSHPVLCFMAVRKLISPGADELQGREDQVSPFTREADFV